MNAKIEFEKLLESLERFGTLLPKAVADLSESDYRWKPQTDDWSILEVVCHLADEEVEDFGMRLKMTLEDPSQNWPPLNPPQAAIDRRYNEQSLPEVIDRFKRARTDSTLWLKSLPDDIDWQVTHHHPSIGPMSAGNLLASWAAHDWLHMRQISKRMFQLVQRDATSFNTAYAGSW
jgi:hypothetical protein